MTKDIWQQNLNLYEEEKNKERVVYSLPALDNMTAWTEIIMTNAQQEDYE